MTRRDVERARELVKHHCTESDDHDWPQDKCRKCEEMVEQIVALLNSVRLEEAKYQFEEMEKLPLNKRREWKLRRIASLEGEQQP